ncbi:hypothetical protein [Micromonospora echinospora]
MIDPNGEEAGNTLGIAYHRKAEIAAPAGEVARVLLRPVSATVAAAR